MQGIQVVDHTSTTTTFPFWAAMALFNPAKLIGVIAISEDLVCASEGAVVIWASSRSNPKLTVNSKAFMCVLREKEPGPIFFMIGLARSGSLRKSRRLLLQL